MLDQEQVSASDLIEHLKIPRFTKYAEFRFQPVHVKKNTATGQTSHARGFGLQPVYQINGPEGPLEIRYSDSRRKDKDGWAYTLVSHKMLDFNSELLVFSRPTDLEKYVWYFLHPSNDTNPYRDRNKTSMFYFYDREGESATENAKTTLTVNAIQQIATMDIASLRIAAAGLRYTTTGGIERIVSRVNESGEQEMRNQLTKLAMADGQFFTTAFHSGSNTVVGMLRYAVDNNIIKMDQQNWGKSWHWNTATHRGTPITDVRKGEDEFAALQAAFMSNHSELLPVLNAALSTLRAEQVADEQAIKMVPQEDITMEYIESLGLDQIITSAIVYDLIGYDRKTGDVSFVGADGQFLEPAVVYSAKAGQWQQELKTSLSSADGLGARAELNRRMFAYINDNPAPASAVSEQPGAATHDPKKRGFATRFQPKAKIGAPTAEAVTSDSEPPALP